MYMQNGKTVACVPFDLLIRTFGVVEGTQSYQCLTTTGRQAFSK